MATVSNRISNCKKVERYEGDLDEHYEKFFDDDGVRDITVQLKKVMES